jgi:23S rRNA (adenine2503-C2)-methyltransferase
MRDILNLTLAELNREMVTMGEPGYRAAQIFSWLYKRGAGRIEGFTDLSKALREKMTNKFFVGTLGLFGSRRSSDGTEKFLFKLHDGHGIETVLIPSGERKTVCLSSQAGCKFACAFCASGLHGFKRNLTPSEMTGQVRYLEHAGGHKITNFVFMGMGEPLDNYENLEKALRIMNAPEGMGIAARRITISTCGIVPGIQRLAKLDLQVNLSLSLHAVTDRLRDKLMPINRKYPLEKIIEACEAYLGESGRMMTLEYILIERVNDTQNDIEGLAGIARRLRAKVNLISYSQVPAFNFKAPTERSMRVFIDRLEERRVKVTLRQSKGRDIEAACGQLAGKLMGPRF